MRIGIQTWGSEGDIRPFIALALGLSRVGHSVTLLTTDIARRDYSPLLKGSRVVWRPVATPVFKDSDLARDLVRQLNATRDRSRQARLIVEQSFDPVVEEMTQASLGLCAESDLVVGHFMLHFLKAAAEKADIPHVTVQLTPGFVPTAHEPPLGLPDVGPFLRRLFWKIVRWVINRGYLPRVNPIRERMGLRPVRDVLTQAWASPLLNLIAVSPTLAPRPSDYGPQHIVCGQLTLPEREQPLPEGLRRFLDTGRAPVYFTYGSVMPQDPEPVLKTGRIWVEAARRAGCRAVLQLPEVPGLDELRGEGVFVVGAAPHSSVFPACAAVVHHGGAGTTQAALRSGVPSVVVAHYVDQFFWARTLCKLGVAGPGLYRGDCTARRLAGSLKRVLGSAEIKGRARKLADRMRGEDGVAAAVDAIARIGNTYVHGEWKR